MPRIEQPLSLETEAPERRWEDRRRGADRRGGLDRRGSGSHQPLSLDPRPYGFREFSERRTRQDRRIYRSDGEDWDRRVANAITDNEQDALRSLLTNEEIRYLLRCGRRGRR
jgi:hypothetical protein